MSVRVIRLPALILLLLSASDVLFIHSQGVPQFGYTILTADPGTPIPVGFALLSYSNTDGVLVSRTAFAPTGEIYSGRVFIDERESRTGVSLVNPSRGTATVLLILRDAFGREVGRQTELLAGGELRFRFVNDVFDTVPSGFTGSVAFESDRGLAASGLKEGRNQYDEPIYTALPVFEGLVSGMGRVVIPQIAAGEGYSSELIVLNAGNREMSGVVELLGGDGRLLGLGRGLDSRFRYRLQANGVLRIELDGDSALRSGYALLTPDPGSAAPCAYAAIKFKGDDFLVTEASVPGVLATDSARLFLSGHTGLAIANAGNPLTEVTFTLMDARGGFLQRSRRTIDADGHLSIFVDELFPSLPDEFTGLLEFNSTSPVSAVAVKITYNTRADPIFTMLPFADLGRLPEARGRIFSQVAFGGGLSTTWMFVQPDVSFRSSGRLDFFGTDGTGVSTPLAEAIGNSLRYELEGGSFRQTAAEKGAVNNGEEPPGDTATIASITILDPDSNLPANEVTVNEGSTVKLKLSVLDTNGVERTDFPLTYFSINTDIAIVDVGGNVRGVKAGFSTVTISSGGLLTLGTITVVKLDSGTGGFDINGIAQDRGGRLFLTNPAANVILTAPDLKQAPSVYAGLPGVAGYKNDFRLQSLFRNPAFLVFNQSSGNIFVSDSANNVIRAVGAGPEGKVETLAGTGAIGSQDGTATTASFSNPQGLALDDRGYLWVADSDNHTIRRINLFTRTVETVAGKAGAAGSADGTGTDARFNGPKGIAVEGESLARQLEREGRGEPPPPTRVIVTDTGNGLIRRITEGGKVETLTTTGPVVEFVDRSRLILSKAPAGAPARFTVPTGVAVDAFGNVHVTEPSSGRVRTILQNGTVVSAIQTNSFAAPKGVIVSASGKLLVADKNRLAGECTYGEPQITSITPDKVNIKAGDRVTVKGKNFAPDTLLVAGTTLIIGSEVADTQTITFTAPALPSGRMTLTAQNRGGLGQWPWFVEAIPLNQLPSGYITTVAGGSNYVGDGGSATAAGLKAPSAVAVDPSGNVYIVDANMNRVRMVRAGTGTITTVAGTGEADFTGDNGLSVLATLDIPRGIALDSAGNLFVSDFSNSRIRKIDSRTRFITTIAGNGDVNFYGDGGLATRAALAGSAGLAVDTSGNLFIVDDGNERIRKVNTITGIITTVAGGGGAWHYGDGVPATEAQFYFPMAIAVDNKGNLFIADTYNNVVSKVDAITGTITRVAGTWESGFSGDNGPATSARLNTPIGVSVDSEGNLYISDEYNYRIRRVDGKTGIITTVAGNGGTASSGDNGPATAAQIGIPWGVTVDAAGNLYIADPENSRVRKVSTSGIITTFAGNGATGTTGDNGPATGSNLENPWRIAMDSADNLFIADTNNQRIRKVTASTGIITTVAGTGKWGFAGDNGLATAASFRYPFGVAVDNAGNLFIADRKNDRIRKVTAVTGIITTVAGSGTCCFGGDNGLATTARISYPYGVAVDASGNLFIADTYNSRIRRVDAVTKIITTVAGSFGNGLGDNDLATSAQISYPKSLALDKQGNLYITDTDHHRIRKVNNITKIITTIAGTGVAGYGGDGGPAVLAQLSYPKDVIVDDSGNIYISDSDNARLRRISAATGIIETIAGTGNVTLSGDGGPAKNADMGYTKGLAFDRAGNLYFGDPTNNRIRAIRGPVGVSCSFTLSPSSRIFSSAAAVGGVSLGATSSCNWVASSNTPWITITSGSSGVGNGTVNYSVAANTGTAGRQGTLAIAAKTFTVTQAGTGGSYFSDVPTTYWAFDYISAIYDARITTGCGGGKYCPEDNVTREQMAAFIIRALEGDRSSSYCSDGSPFQDVSASNTFCGNIKRLSELQITTVAGNFNPKALVSRGQMAAFIIRALHGESFSYPSTPYFADVPSSHSFFRYVQKLKERSITKTTGTYYVDSYVTRAEMAAFLARAFLNFVTIPSP